MVVKQLKIRLHVKSRIALLMSAFVLLASGAQGAEIEGVVFKDIIRVDGTRLSIRGTGLFRYLGFIKAYVGALYMEDVKRCGVVGYGQTAGN